MGINEEMIWDSLMAEARMAEAFESDWERFGIPYDAIDLRSKSDAEMPPPDVFAYDIPDDTRMAIKSMDQLIQDAGSLPEPCEAWIGLRLPLGVSHSLLEISVGDYICLVGIVSASLPPEPAVFAAGRNGALFRVRLLAALPMVGDLEKPGEMELVPPRNSCYKVESIHMSAGVTDSKGRQWERMVLEATQVEQKAC